jgi:hypothetical protein
VTDSEKLPLNQTLNVSKFSELMGWGNSHSGLTSSIEHSPDCAGDAGCGAADVEFEPVGGDEGYEGGWERGRERGGGGGGGGRFSRGCGCGSVVGGVADSHDEWMDGCKTEPERERGLRLN